MPTAYQVLTTLQRSLKTLSRDLHRVPANAPREKLASQLARTRTRLDGLLKKHDLARWDEVPDKRLRTIFVPKGRKASGA